MPPIIYKCGCQNERHEPTGALQCVSKCARHTRASQAPEGLGEAYYTELGLLKGGVLQPTNHVAELVDALGPFPETDREGLALEIGCGVSPYVGAIKDAGWVYMGLDASLWAVEWTCNQWDVGMIHGTWEQANLKQLKFGLIFSAHALEHMADAPAALQKMADALEPGGQLWLVVPDDSDPVNPDHIWFWSFESLTNAIKQAGLVVDLMTSRRIIERESFIYVRAIKP